jgi:hypothetical protein
MNEKELEYYLNDYEPRALSEVSQLLGDHEDEMEEIFKPARENENVFTNSDYKRINALIDYLKFKTVKLKNQKGGKININFFIVIRNIKKRDFCISFNTKVFYMK